MMKRISFPALTLAAIMLFSSAACAQAADGVTHIVLSDSRITVDGRAVSADPGDAVYTGAEIVYYRDGTDASYGEGTEAQKHSEAEAAAHTVVTITQAGTYRLSGSLAAGQVAVDLDKDAKDDPQAVVTLILDNVDVTCTAAPALIFYNVYECDREFVAYDNDENPDYEPSARMDTSAAGANVIIAAGSENTFTGSHVARIYKEGTTKKLHKYDGAFYSKMSMNIFGEDGDDSGVLNIVADNEGMNSELHLTINGGTVMANANPRSGDGGIDADSPILINGGTVCATGSRNDAADTASAQPYIELSFASTLPAGSEIALTGENGDEVLKVQIASRDFQSLTISAPVLELGVAYNVYVDGVLQCWSGNSFGMMGGHGGFGGGRPEGMEPREGFDPGQRPEGMEPPEGFDPSQRMDPPQGFTPPCEGFGGGLTGATQVSFAVGALPFTDVWDSDESYEAIRAAYTAGAMTGTGDGRFSPNATVTRAQAVTVLARLAGAEAAERDGFTDVEAGSWYSGYVGWALEAGIVEGDGQGRFLPQESVTAEHMALMLSRYDKNYVNSFSFSGELTRGQLAQMLSDIM